MRCGWAPLNGEKNDSRGNGSKSSRSSIGCFHGPMAAGSVRLYGNAIRRIKIRAHRSRPRVISIGRRALGSIYSSESVHASTRRSSKQRAKSFGAKNTSSAIDRTNAKPAVNGALRGRAVAARCSKILLRRRPPRGLVIICTIVDS